jgi:hypothetical protein
MNSEKNFDELLEKLKEKISFLKKLDLIKEIGIILEILQINKIINIFQLDSERLSFLEFICINNMTKLKEDDILVLLEKFFLPNDKIKLLKIILPFIDISEKTLNNNEIYDMFIIKTNKEEIKNLINNRINYGNESNSNENSKIIFVDYLNSEEKTNKILLRENDISYENLNDIIMENNETKELENDHSLHSNSFLKEDNENNIEKFITVCDPKTEKSPDKKNTFTTYLIEFNVQFFHLN